ncbi:hypothetical protein A0256_01440 [Mucilaginibacter sp. PAMC 26640]|nr:hypothetical protein A0256_01440 [Mucilaginibacter sp. PAMC 26640]
MLNKNCVAFGLLIGAVMPAITWIVFSLILQNDAIIMDKPAAPYLIATVLNLVLLRYYFKNNMDKTVNGIMIVTFAVMLLVFTFKMHITS